MINDATHQHIEAFWREYERYQGTWTLPTTLVLHFGRRAELMLPSAERFRNANHGWDPCLHEEGHPAYAVVDLFCRAAEAIIEARIPENGRLDERLRGYGTGRRTDGGLNVAWANPLLCIERSKELKDGLVAELKEATLNGEVPVRLRRSA